MKARRRAGGKWKMWTVVSAGLASSIAVIGSAGGVTSESIIATTELISKASPGSGGQSGNGSSLEASVSGDGRFVAFQSESSNLATGGKQGSHIFLKDRTTGINTLISAKNFNEGVPAQSGSINPAISEDGKFVAFASSAADLVPGDTNGRIDIFVFDVSKRKMIRVPARFGAQANGDSFSPALSGNGNFVTFASEAGNLTPSDSNATSDVFRYNLTSKTMDLVSHGIGGSGANGPSRSPSISRDGSKVAYESAASNLVTTDTNGVQDVFVRSMNGIQSSRVSVSRDGVQANAESRHPAISALGNRVAFSSSATNLTLASDTNQKPDVFTRVIADGERTTERVSRSSVGDQANGGSFRPSVNEDGTKVSFQSGATNLTGTPDVNNVSDVFITNISCSPFCTNLVSVGSDGLAADRMSRDSDLTADGKMVLFNSLEQLTAEPDKNEGRFDIYARVLPMSS